jgi:hypothetical protein
MNPSNIINDSISHYLDQPVLISSDPPLIRAASTSSPACAIEISPETLESAVDLTPLPADVLTPDTPESPIKREVETCLPTMITPQKSQIEARKTILAPLVNLEQKKRRIVKKRTTINNQW